MSRAIREFLAGDYTAAQALRDEPGKSSPHAARLAVRDQLATAADGDAIDRPLDVGPIPIDLPE
jgi:hypothetical protein